MAHYVNAPLETLRRSLIGPFDFGLGRTERLPDFQVFSRHGANDPSADKAEWIITNLIAQGAVREMTARSYLADNAVFRSDLFDLARRLVCDEHDLEPAKAAIEQELIPC